MADPSLGNLTGNLAFTTKDAVVAVRQFSDEINRPIGIVEQLEINLKDLKFAISAATDPKDLQRLNEEFVRLEATLRRVGPMTERNLVGQQRALNIELRSSTQGLIGLAFILNSLSTDDVSGQFTVFRNSLVQAMNSAIGTTFALNAMGKSFAEFALPGGIALGVLTALVGILAGFNKEAEEAEKKELAKAVKGFAKDQVGGTIEEFEIEQKTLQTKIAQLKADIKNTLANPAGIEKKGKGDFAIELPILTKEQKEFIAQTEKALKMNVALLDSVEEKLPGATAAYKKHAKELEDARNDLLHRLDESTVARNRADDKMVADAMQKGLELLQQDLAGIELKRKLEVELITDKYAHEKALAQKEFEDENDKIKMLDIGQTRRDELRALNRLAFSNKLAAIDKKHAEDLKKEEERTFTKSLQILHDMDNVLGKLIPASASSFVDEFRKAIDIAIEIVKILNSIQEAGGFLNFITSLLGTVLALFGGPAGKAAGAALGATGGGKGGGGSGGGNVAEGMKDKVAVTNNINELAGKGSFNPAGSVPDGPTSNNTSTPIVNVHLHGTMDGQTFMKKNAPKYEKYVKHKFV